MNFRNYLLAALPDAARATLLPLLTETALERGQVVFEPGDGPDHVFFPSTTVLSVVTLMRDGSAVESSTIGLESASPLLPALIDHPVKTRVFAQIGGGCLRLSSASLRACAQADPDLMSLLLRHIEATAFQSEQGVACNILHAAPARLARWLLMTQDRTGTRTLPLTQDYMAIMTGVQRTTISSVANQLRAEGLIRFSRGSVEVLDREALVARACECYGEIRSEFDALQRPA